MENLKEFLGQFVEWHKKIITGDEKGQAQIFLDRLFKAFGHDGVLDVGGQTEFRIRKSAEDGGGVSFADLVWKPVVLIEMKKRGTDLQKHFRQAFDYWIRLVPNRPRYVVLCNFDEFRIYDFETQMDSPVDIIATIELPVRWGALAFLAQMQPVFGNDRVAVTRQAADALADCFKLLVRTSRSPQVDRVTAQRFILQMLVALFAEDIDLLPQYFVTNLLNECKSPTDTFDLLGGLFEAMNNRAPAVGGRYKGVRYFNGGLFVAPAKLELQEEELNQLRHAATFNWSKVQPDIFGTLFQHSMEAKERHAYGAHFTSPTDIMKIVGPTIVDPWHSQIEGARTLAQLRGLLDRLHHFRVLDPACGSGNFLYIAYRELKRLEARIFERMESEFKSEASPTGQMRMSFLSAQNFYGLDILPFAVELAKVTMMIGRKLAIDELHITESPLPLDNLDLNFITADALITPDGLPTQWPKADIIIGNPPFLGSRYFAKEHGYDYVRKVHAAFPDVPKMADFCVYWFRKAADHLPTCTTVDPLAGRAGLVGTQNIRNNESREGGMDYILKTGTLIEAVDNQPWSGEANVSVSIANWVNSQDPVLLPQKRKLWFKLQQSAGPKKTRKRGSGAANKEYELNFVECDYINSSLSAETDVGSAKQLACNAEPKRAFQGQNPVHDGFKLEPSEAAQLLKAHPGYREVIFPYLLGMDLVTTGRPSIWIIDFAQRNMLDAAQFSAAFDIVKEKVMSDVLAKAAQEKAATGKENTRWTRMAERWWQFRDWMPGTMAVVNSNSRYIVCPRVTKRPTFEFVSRDVHPDGSLAVFGFSDDYSFGVLQSKAHWQWFAAKCSKLTERFRYTSDTVFDTFPWPQSPTVKNVEAVASASRELRGVRAEAMLKLKGGLRALYRTLELPGANPLKEAHAVLDHAVLAAYGFSPKLDLLAQLLSLNLETAAEIAKGNSVTAPGIPAAFPHPRALITEDCILPPRL